MNAQAARAHWRAVALAMAIPLISCGDSFPASPSPQGPPGGSGSARVEAVYVSYPGYASVAPLFVGQSEQFRATVGFTSGAGGSCPQQLAWRSSDPAVALVTPDGVARMLTPGSVSISATCSGVTGTANVGVYRPVTFSGTVRDPQGGPLSGVSVWVRTAGKFGASATTDSAGRFFIARVPQGVAAPVSVSKTGYRPLSIGPLPFSADSTMDFTLERQ